MQTKITDTMARASMARLNGQRASSDRISGVTPEPSDTAMTQKPTSRRKGGTEGRSPIIAATVTAKVLPSKLPAGNPT